MSRRRSRRVDQLSGFDSNPRRSPRLSSRYLRGDGNGPVFPLQSVTYSATSRQTLSGFKDYDDEMDEMAGNHNVLNESGQSVPLTFEEDIQDGDSGLPEHLYGLDTGGRVADPVEDEGAQPLLEVPPKRSPLHPPQPRSQLGTPKRDGSPGDDAGICSRLLFGLLNLLYKFGSLFYLVSAAIFCLDVMVLHRLYTVFHVMTGGMDTRPTKPWQRFYILPLVLVAVVIFLLGGGLLPGERNQFVVHNGTQINITEIRVQITKTVAPMILKELQSSFQESLESQVEERIKQAINESEERLKSAMDNRFSVEAEKRDRLLTEIRNEFTRELNMSLEHHLLELRMSVKDQLSELQQRILEEAEGDVSEALVKEIVASHLEAINEQLQAMEAKLNQTQSDLAQLELLKKDLEEMQSNDRKHADRLTAVEGDLDDGKISQLDLETKLEDVSMEVTELSKTSKTYETQIASVQQEDEALRKSLDDFKQQILDRIDRLEEGRETPITRDEVGAVFTEELQKVMDDSESPLNSWLSNYVDHLDKGKGTPIKDIKQLIEAALYRYSADKIAKFDFALENSGGSVVVSKCSQTYAPTMGTVSLLGWPLWRINSSPKLLIQPTVYPGDCWAFEGSKGHALIKIQGPVVITGVSLEHIPEELTPNGSRASAPKDFDVYGLADPEDKPTVRLGRFAYDLEKSPIQQFELSNTQAFEYIYFDFLSNHGNELYTCIYRVRVHGHYKE